MASPELAFLDSARQLGFHRTVLLGMQLCSSKPGNRESLTTVQRLQSFLDKCHGHHGRKAAIQAVQYIADNSWSVMESLLFMQLTLPYKFGGLGFSGAALNQEIKIRKKGCDQKMGTLYADLYWEKAKLIVEYDSYAFHNNMSSWIKDARRLATLENNGYRVLTINTEQLYNDQAFNEVAQVIAKRLEKRIYIRSLRYSEQKDLLRGLLPRRDAAAKGKLTAAHE